MPNFVLETKWAQCEYIFVYKKRRHYYFISSFSEIEAVGIRMLLKSKSKSVKSIEALLYPQLYDMDRELVIAYNRAYADQVFRQALTKL